ncbi:hypothetical protein TURU_140675 [Turdus rufiventris]|nr:hypothetical protein TURU_140675 [Turdus rufiventris]
MFKVEYLLPSTRGTQILTGTSSTKEIPQGHSFFQGTYTCSGAGSFTARERISAQWISIDFMGPTCFTMLFFTGCSIPDWHSSHSDRSIWESIGTGSRPVTSDIPHSSVLFDIFIIDLEARVECTPSKLTDHTKLGGDADLQRNLDSLEHWAMINVMKFSKSKSWILHLALNKTGQKYKLAEVCLESSPAERDLGLLVSSTQCGPAVCPGSPESKPILGCIKHSITSQSEVIMLLHSALVQPHQ